MISVLIGFLGALVIGPIVIKCCQWLYPPDIRDNARYGSLKELEKELSPWAARVVPIAIAIIVVGTAFWWILVLALAGLRFAVLDGAVYRLVPQPIVYAFPAFFLAIGSTPALARVYFRRRLGSRYRAFQAYQTLTSGYEVDASERLLCRVGITIGIVMFVLVLQWYVLFHQDGIVIKRMCSWRPVWFAYSDIARIEVAPSIDAPNGSVVLRFAIAFRFESGERWSSLYDPEEADERKLGEIVRFVAEKAGKSVETVKMIRRADEA